VAFSLSLAYNQASEEERNQMPRGVPKNGKRKTQAAMARDASLLTNFQTQIPAIVESDEQILSRIGERFEMLDYLTDAAIKGDIKSAIFSGPPGLGKSFTVEQKLENVANSSIVKGFSRATGIYQSLYEMSNNGVLVFDDCDSVFGDDIALNLLKSATDSSDKRIISWRAETKMQTQDGDFLPTSFEFKGSVIFITNQDFDAHIDSGSRLAPHFEALINRSFYLDLMLKTRRDYFLRIKQMVDKGMLKERGNTIEQSNKILGFLEKNMDKFRNGDLSLRTAVKLGNMIKVNKNWERVASTTMLKQR